MEQHAVPSPLATLPGPSRRITVEPIRLPTHAPPRVVPPKPPVPDRDRPPERTPARSR
jgi:hypothetical protein